LGGFDELGAAIIECKRCVRLVEYRQRIAQDKRRMYTHWDYWGKPIPGFGDPQAKVLILGLAPAAHGGNRTGRLFTGDKSGDWLFGTLYEHGFASQPTSQHRSDGLKLREAFVSAAIRCAPPENKPRTDELLACQPFLLREMELLPNLKVVVALGGLAFLTYLAAREKRGEANIRPRPRFGHGVSYLLPGGIMLVGSYHPSQRNTQTRRLTAQMFSDVFGIARAALINGN
jgi:uracil-DNA glycosylase family 4